MNAASLLSDAGFSAVDTVIAGANANSGGSQSNSAAEGGSQFGDVLAGVTAGSTPPPRSDATAPWRSGLAAMLPSLDQDGQNTSRQTSSSSPGHGSASAGNAATNEDDSYTAALGKAAASATAQTGSDDTGASSVTGGKQRRIPDSPSLSSPIANAGSAAATNPSAQSQAGAARGDTLALLQKIAGSQFSTSADQASPIPPSSPSSDSDGTGEIDAAADSPPQPAAAASAGSTAAAGNTFALFQKIMGVQFAGAHGPSKPSSATTVVAPDSDPRSTDTTQGSDRERTGRKQSADATSTASSSTPPAAPNPNLAVAMPAIGTVIPVQPAFTKKPSNASADLSAAASLSNGTGTPASGVGPVTPDGGTREVRPAELSATMAQFNAKVTSQETHLPPAMPLSPMTQIFNTIVGATATLEAPAGSSAASSSSTALTATGAVTKTLTLALEPDELGKVEINMSLSNGQLNIAIGVDRSGTLQRLRDDQDTLVTSLGSSGYDIHSVSIHGATGDLSSFSSQPQTAGGQASTQQSAANAQAGQSGSGSGQGRSGNDSYAERNDNGSTGSRQDQPLDQTVAHTSGDGLYV